MSIYRFNLQFPLSQSKREERTFTIFALTLYFFFLWGESYLRVPIITNKLTGFLAIMPIIIFILPFYFYFIQHPPKYEELERNKDNFTGIIIFCISAILAFFFRKYYI